MRIVLYNNQAKGVGRMDFLREHSFVIAQIIGFCAMATAIISFQQKKRTHIMIFQLICTGLWSLHFFVLGNMPGCALNGIMTVRCVIYYFKETQKWAQHKIWLVLFLIAGITAGALTWDSLWSILPLIGTIISTVALWLSKPKHIRLLTIPVAVVWFVYNVHSLSYPGMCNEVFALVSILTAMWRLDRRKKIIE